MIFPAWSMTFKYHETLEYFKKGYQLATGAPTSRTVEYFSYVIWTQWPALLRVYFPAKVDCQVLMQILSPVLYLGATVLKI